LASEARHRTPDRLYQPLDFARAHPTEFVEYGDVVRVGHADELNEAERFELREHVRTLGPWRKGPFELFGLRIDAHWKSELKWDRAANAARVVGGFHVKSICDVGCNNGYYLFRLLDAGATLAVGLDPVTQFQSQFEFVSAFHPDQRARFDLAGFESLSDVHRYEVVLCMGVIYHQKNPFALLEKLRESMAPGGSLILETLGAPIGEQMIVPRGKYAGAGGIWFVPGPDAVVNMLRRCGFGAVSLVEWWDAREEQQRSEYANLPCMSEFCEGDLTKEGYPFPRRYIFVARR